jgi:hypothetical protein
VIYCDNCGEGIREHEPVHAYEACPVSFESGNAGESAQLCDGCNGKLIVERGLGKVEGER